MNQLSNITQLLPPPRYVDVVALRGYHFPSHRPDHRSRLLHMHHRASDGCRVGKVHLHLQAIRSHRQSQSPTVPKTFIAELLLRFSLLPATAVAASRNVTSGPNSTRPRPSCNTSFTVFRALEHIVILAALGTPRPEHGSAIHRPGHGIVHKDRKMNTAAFAEGLRPPVARRPNPSFPVCSDDSQITMDKSSGHRCPFARFGFPGQRT